MKPHTAAAAGAGSKSTALKALLVLAACCCCLGPTSAQTEGDGSGAAQEEEGGGSTTTCVIDDTGRWSSSPPVSLLVLEEGKLPNVYDRTTEFSAATGARVEITQVSIAEWQSEVFADAGLNGPRTFDGYSIKGNWVPGLVEADGLADLSEFVSAGDLWTDLDWTDIVPVVRDSICIYDGNVYSIPIDADYVVSAARDDLLLAQSASGSLDTWEEWVSFAEANNDQDLNGDGVPDYGACLAHGDGNTHFSVFAGLWAVASPHLQFGGRKAGAFFDTDTLEPLLTNPDLHFVEALELYKRLVAAAGPAMTAADAKNLFQSGRCATWLSLPGFVFGVQDTGGIKAPNRTDASMARYKAPGVGCTSKVDCPFAKTVSADSGSSTGNGRRLQQQEERLINRSPFFSTSGTSLAIGSGASATSRQLLFELFTYISAKAQSNHDVTLRTSFSDPFRNSQLGDDALNRLVGTNGWDPETAEEYLKVTSDILNEDGAALDLRVPGLGLYMTSVLEAVAPFVYRGEGTAEEAAEVAAAAWREIPEQVFVGSSAEAANNAMLGIYRAQLGLPPIVRDQDSGFNVQALIIAVSVLGGIFIVALLALFVYWIKKTYERKKKLEEEAAALINRQVAEALDVVKEFQAPLVLMRGDHFLALGKILDHETLRDRGSLVFIDTMDGFMELFNHKYVTIFFSHQWCAYNEPDPNAVQYQVMSSALKEIATKEKRPIEDVYVWVDYFSIPQTNRPIQRLAINSLPALASILQYFVAICPPAEHAETTDKCDRESYFSRCWIRAEVMSYWSRRGTENMFYAESREDGFKGVLRPLAPEGETKESMGAVRVFQGNLTCCRRAHNNGTVPCDRQELMLPMLGLYAEIYANRHLSSVKPIYEAIESHLDSIYPRTFEYETGEGPETRVLFGDLIPALRERFDEDQSGRRASQKILAPLMYGNQPELDGSNRSLRSELAGATPVDNGKSQNSAAPGEEGKSQNGAAPGEEGKSQNDSFAEEP